LQCIQHSIFTYRGCFMLKPDFFFNIYCIYNEREFIQDGDTFKYIQYNLVSVRACVYYWFFLDFLGDERELLNAILFRQIHTLQDLSGIVVFRGHVYGIEYMFRMLNISSMFMICQSTDYITHFATCCMVWKVNYMWSKAFKFFLNLISWKIRCRQILY
jgi:hypothetical protein